MTAQEQQMLQDLTERISRTQLQEKDPDAEQFLQQTLGRNPDALYILAQTVLVQQYALRAAFPHKSGDEQLRSLEACGSQETLLDLLESTVPASEAEVELGLGIEHRPLAVLHLPPYPG